MSTDRTAAGGWANPKKLPRGPGGRALCRCGCGREVPVGRRTFFGQACVEEWRLRTDASHQRHQVFERDLGVCESCGLDTLALRHAYQIANQAAVARVSLSTPAGAAIPEVLPLSADEIEQGRQRLQGAVARRFAFYATTPLYRGPLCRALLLGFDPDRRSWWDMDHRQPVVEGGGVRHDMTRDEVLANLRTLCQPCHKRETAALAARRALARREARQPSLRLATDADRKDTR